MQVKKQQLELDIEQQTGSKLGKKYVKAVYYHCLFNLYVEYIMWNARLDESQAGIKIAGRNNKSQRCRWYHFNGRKWRGTKEPLDDSERGALKSWFKTQNSKNEDDGIQSLSLPWQIEGKNV